MQAISNLEKLYMDVFVWFERRKGPLPIKPALVIFKEKAGYQEFLRQNIPSTEDIESEACTLFKMVDGKLQITIAVQNSLSLEPIAVQACTLIHELNHVYEETKTGKITFHIVEPKNATDNREIATWMDSVNLMEEYFGKPLPKWAKDRVFAMLKGATFKKKE